MKRNSDSAPRGKRPWRLLTVAAAVAAIGGATAANAIGGRDHNGRHHARSISHSGLIASKTLLAPEGRIAFDHTDPNGREDIFTIAPTGRDLRQITHTPAGQGGSEAPEWTPDVTRLYFDSDRAGHVHVFVTDRAGRHVAQITKSSGVEFDPGISPDGKLLAFEHDSLDSKRGGIFLSHREHSAFHALKQLTHAPGLATGGADSGPEFSPDHSKIVFDRALSTKAPDARSAIFVMDIDGRHLTQLTEYSMNAIYPRWSPDGSRIAFSSNGDNFTDALPANIYVIRADGSHLTQITHRSRGSHAFTPDWSPDGNQLIYATASPGQPGTNLEILNLATGVTNVIYRGASGSQNQDPAWSRH